jgi:hypothetical protein
MYFSQNEMFRPLFIILGVFCVAYCTHAWQSDLEVASRQLKAKNILNYGDSCSVSDETKRAEMGENMMKTMMTMDTSRFSSLAADIRALTSSVGNLCNSQKNLQCQAHGKCGCARQKLMGVEVSTSREGNNCRLDRGSLCIPQEALAGMGSDAPDLRCQTRTSCLVKRTRGACTQNAMTREIMSGMDMSRGFPSPQDFMKTYMEKLTEGLCQCG